MTNDVCREEMSKFAALSGCTYNNGICFVGIEPKCIIEPEISLRQSTHCLRKRSVSSVGKEMQSWVPSAYK